MREMKDTSELSKWVEKLSDEDRHQRRVAVWRLSDIGEAAEPAIIKALIDEHWSVRAYAASSLGRIGKPAEDIISALTKALSDEDWWVRNQAGEALGKLGQSVEYEVKIPADEYEVGIPVFLGFLPKKIMPRPEWINVPHVREICSVCKCYSTRPPEMFGEKKWNYNRAGLYDDLGSVFDDVPTDERDQYQVFAYKAYNIQLDDSGVHEVDILEHLPMSSREINPEPDLTDFHRIGYDLIEGIHYLSFGCSPLACNSLANYFEVNQFCLVDNPQYAIKIGMKFDGIGAEPPPYYVFEVYQKHC